MSVAHVWGLYEYETNQCEHVTTMLGPWQSITELTVSWRHHKSKMAAATNMKIVMSAYLSDKWSDYDEI